MNEEELVTALNTVNECLRVIGERIQVLEEYVSDMPLHVHDKLLYKPTNHENYLNIKENFDHLYERLDQLENGM